MMQHNWRRQLNGSSAEPGADVGYTADRGYGLASVDRDLHQLGVRRDFEHRRSFRDKTSHPDMSSPLTATTPRALFRS
jgi:hypothetical protein